MYIHWLSGGNTLAVCVVVSFLSSGSSISPQTRGRSSFIMSSPADFPVLVRSEYDRGSVRPGILHVGVGAFHRAHQAVYLDELLEKSGSTSLEWGIVGVNLRAESRPLADQLNARDGQYVLKNISNDGKMRYQEVRSLMKVLDWERNNQEVLKMMGSEEIKVITITVTESGYYLDSTSNLNVDHPDISSELRGTQSLTSSIYGCLYHGLKSRKTPITVQCCDNIRSNGDILSKCFMKYLELLGDESVCEWVKSNVTFPNSMVDRITPRPDEAQSSETESLFGIGRDPSVLSEDFTQWVIERKFASVYPDLMSVGCEIVENVHPYEEAKIRILNGGHTALAYFGVLKGFKTYDEAIRDTELESLFDRYETTEVIPGLPSPSPVDHEKYLATTKSRFQNSYISDTLERICRDGFSKISIFVLPTICANFERGHVPINAIRIVASWFAFLCMVQRGQVDFHYIDPSWEQLQTFLSSSNGSERFADSTNLWGDIPTKWPEFSRTLIEQIGDCRQCYLGDYTSAG